MDGKIDGKNDFEYFMSKALYDPEFQSIWMKEGPAAALKSIGIEPTKEVTEAIGKADLDSILKVAQAFGEYRAFAGC